MREGRCTIDSSCVVALHHLDLLPELSMLFSAILVPKAVREELSKRRAGKDLLKLLFREYALFQRCDDYDKGAVDFLLAERRRVGSADRGEAEAAVQASQVGGQFRLGVSRNALDIAKVPGIGINHSNRS